MWIIFFFMYVFPALMLGLPIMHTSKLVGIMMLILGLALWIFVGLIILSFAAYPKKLQKTYQKILESGQEVTAEIVVAQNIEREKAPSLQKLMLKFENLAGKTVKTPISCDASAINIGKLAPGQFVHLKLNHKGSKPPFILSSSDYSFKTRPILWVWFCFHLIYIAAFLFISYYIQNEGSSWQYLSPIHPWVWSPLLSLFLGAMTGYDLRKNPINVEYDLCSKAAKKRLGELVLYGTLTSGQITDCKPTGFYLDDKPQYLFTIAFDDAVGQRKEHTAKEIVSLAKLPELKTAPVEVLYLANRTEVFVAICNF